MGAFADMFPGRKPEQKVREDSSDGQGHLPRIPDGPIDLDAGVLRLEPRQGAAPTGTGTDRSGADREGGEADTDGG